MGWSLPLPSELDIYHLVKKGQTIQKYPFNICSSMNQLLVKQKLVIVSFEAYWVGIWLLFCGISIASWGVFPYIVQTDHDSYRNFWTKLGTFSQIHVSEWELIWLDFIACSYQWVTLIGYHNGGNWYHIPVQTQSAISRCCWQNHLLQHWYL